MRFSARDVNELFRPFRRIYKCANDRRGCQPQPLRGHIPGQLSGAFCMAKNRFNFTKKDLEKIPVKERQQYYFDSQMRGLAFCVSRGNTRSFVFHTTMNRITKRKVIGSFPEMTVEQARRIVAQELAKKSQGDDPFRKSIFSAAQFDVSITVEQLFRLYLENYAQHHTKSWRDTESNFNRYFGQWKTRTTQTIKRIEIQQWIDQLAVVKGKHTANRCYDTMRAIMSWGIKKEIIDHRNPCLGVDKYKVKARDRFVQPGDEFQRLSQAIDAESDETMRDFFWMCLFTGARKSNVLSMQWADINFDLRTWTIPDTKNGDPHIVALIDEAIKILRRRCDGDRHQWVFPSARRTDKHLTCPKSAWDRIRKRAGIPDLRIHDLRRTLGSYMAIQGISPTIIGKALGHKSLQATAVYARLSQSPVKLAVEQAIGALMTRPE
jgi:integrase